MKTNKGVLEAIANGITSKVTTELLKELGDPNCNSKSFQTVLYRLKLKEKKLKNGSRNAKKLIEFYKLEFVLPKNKDVEPQQESITRERRDSARCFQCEILNTVNKEVSQELTREKKVSENLKKENNSLKLKIIAYKPKRINEIIKRKDTRISVLLSRVRDFRSKLKTSTVNRNNAIDAEIKRVRHLQISNAAYWQRNKSKRIDNLKKKITQQKEELEQLKTSITQFKESPTKNAPYILEVKQNGKTFNEKIRKCIYYCLESQVPVQNASHLVEKVVKEMTGIELSSSPSRRSVARMAREMGVISDLQCGEELLSKANSTLSWDGTSVKGAHINEIHVTTSKKDSVVLGVTNLAGGNTDDYANDIISTVNGLMSSYSKYHQVSNDESVSSAMSNIANTLTDRVAVNHCVVQCLEGKFGKQLNELNCNVHPLDGMALKAKKVLKKREGDKGISSKLFGNECIAINIINAVSKLKHKDGTGDPSSFASFMKMKDIPSSLLPRYVGNRFHVMFHLAGSIFHLKEDLNEFFEKFSSSTSKLIPPLKNDLKSLDGQLELQALGIIGKLVTGPWMEQVYGDKENLGHLEITSLFKTVLASLEQYKNEPDSVLSVTKDSFGAPLSPSTTLTSLQSTKPTNEPDFAEIISLLAGGMKEVLERQLQRYLSGPLSNPNDEMLEQTKSAPHHNLQGERILAMTDSQMRRAPNAKIDYVSSKVKFKINHSKDWLESNENSNSIVNFAIKEGRKLTQKRKQTDLQVEKEKIKRMKGRYQKRDRKKRNEIQKKLREIKSKEADIICQSIKEIYPTITDEQLELCCKVATDAKALKGKSLQHVWYDEQTGQNTTYAGKIANVTRGGKSLVIDYEHDAGNDEGASCSMSVIEVLTDIILEDLIFV